MQIDEKVCSLGKHYCDRSGKFAVPLTDAGKKTRDLIVQNMKTGVYGLEHVKCLCGAVKSQDLTLATVDRYRIPHRTVLCMECGLVRTDPRMTQIAYEDFYTYHYRTLYERTDDYRKRVFQDQQDSARRRYDFICKHVHLAKPAKILEIGCGAGWNLRPFQLNQFDVTGYDFDEYYLGIGRDHGLDLRRGGIATAINDRQKYSLIILSHVVEHFLYPLEELASIVTLLQHDGVLYVEVPSILAVKVNPLKYFQNAHTYSFAPETLRTLMRSIGLGEIAMSPQIESLWRHGGRAETWQSSPETAQIILKHLQSIERYRIFRDFLYGIASPIILFSSRFRKPGKN